MSKKNNILFISSWYPNRLEPTNGNFVQRHAEAVSLLHEVEVLHVMGDRKTKGYVFDEQEVNGIRTLIVYYQKSVFSGINFFRKMRAYHKGFKLMKKPDIVHGNILYNNLLFAVYLKKRYGIPFVVSEHWSIFLNKPEFKIQFIAKQIAKHAEVILPVSKALENALKHNRIGENFYVIGNVVDTKVFIPKYHEKRAKFTFLHISNLNELKKPKEIIRAALKLREKYDNFELHIGGDGDIAALNLYLEKEKNNSFIKTFGALKTDEVASKMQMADCFLLFSEMETQGIVLLESYACGVPVIATKVGGVLEIVTPERGILIEKERSQLLLAMEKVLNKKVVFCSKDELRIFTEDHFSREAIAQKISDIYNTISPSV